MGAGILVISLSLPLSLSQCACPLSLPTIKANLFEALQLLCLFVHHPLQSLEGLGLLKLLAEVVVHDLEHVRHGLVEDVVAVSRYESSVGREMQHHCSWIKNGELKVYTTRHCIAKSVDRYIDANTLAPWHARVQHQKILVGYEKTWGRAKRTACAWEANRWNIGVDLIGERSLISVEITLWRTFSLCL